MKNRLKFSACLHLHTEQNQSFGMSHFCGKFPVHDDGEKTQKSDINEFELTYE